MHKQFSSRRETDRNNALPPASIVEKLQNHVSDAGIKIFNKMNEYAYDNHNNQDDRNALISILSMFNSKAFWDGFADVVTLSPLFTTSNRRTYHAANHNIHDQSWITVGNNMRRAITEVMADHNLSGRDIGLTPDEKRALTPLPYSRHDNRYTA